MKEKFFSRKFIVTLLSFSVSTVALFIGIADFNSWSAFMLALMGIYGTTNVVGKKVDK